MIGLREVNELRGLRRTMKRLIDIFDECGIDGYKYFRVVTDCIKSNMVNPIIYTRSILCLACETLDGEDSSIVGICFLQAYFRPANNVFSCMFEQLEASVEEEKDIFRMKTEINVVIKSEWILSEPEPTRIQWSCSLEDLKRCSPQATHRDINPKAEEEAAVTHYIYIGDRIKIGVNNLYFTEEDAGIIKTEVAKKMRFYERPWVLQLKDLQYLIATFATITFGAIGFVIGKFL